MLCYRRCVLGLVNITRPIIIDRNLRLNVIIIIIFQYQSASQRLGSRVSGYRWTGVMVYLPTYVHRSTVRHNIYKANVTLWWSRLFCQRLAASRGEVKVRDREIARKYTHLQNDDREPYSRTSDRKSAAAAVASRTSSVTVSSGPTAMLYYYACNRENVSTGIVSDCFSGGPDIWRVRLNSIPI